MPLDDTNMSNEAEYANHIPAAVRRQAERADEIVRQLVEPVEDTTTVVDNGDGGSVVAPVADGTPAPVAQPASAGEDWEHKFRTLQGKYDAEIGQVNQLRQTVSNLERLLANLSEREPPAPQPVAAPVTTTVVDGPTDKDKEEYGEDLIAAVQRFVAPLMARHQQEIEGLKNQLGDTRKQTQQTVQVTHQQLAMQQLDSDPEMGARAQHPNGQVTSFWRVLNDDPAFVTWAQLHDPISGHQRLGMLRDAFNAGNAARMKAIFGAYAKEQTVVTGTQPAPTTHTGAAPAPTGRVPLETFAAPGRPSPAPVGAPGDKRMWTQADIAAFYRRVQKGEFASNPAEKARLEQDIVNASMEGRVLKR